MCNSHTKERIQGLELGFRVQLRGKAESVTLMQKFGGLKSQEQPGNAK